MISHTWMNENLKELAIEHDINESSLTQENKKLQEKFLSFLNLTGSLEHIDETCTRYDNMLLKHSENINLLPSLKLFLEIDLKELQNISDPCLFKLLINEPHVAFSIVHNLIYSYIISKLSVEEFQPQQLELHFRFTSVDCMKVCDIPHIPFGTLSFLQGTLLSISTPTKYIRSYVVKCSESSCPFSKIHRIAGKPPIKLPQCTSCNNQLQDIQEACEIGEQMFGLLIVLPEYQHVHESTFYRQAVLVCFQDELMKDLEPGLEYKIVGQMGLKSFRAWTVESTILTLNRIHLHLVPPRIRNLQQDIELVCPGSPWAFVGTLASQLSFQDYPDLCYFNLKMGLLLSLASQAGGARPVAVQALGTDTHTAHRLQRRAAGLRRRGAPLDWAPATPAGHVAQGAGAGAGASGPAGAGAWVEAGPLLLAGGGVCCLGDWAKLKPKAAQAVRSALETGYVQLESQNLKSVPPPSYPLRCSVWTYMFWNGKPKDSNVNNLKALTQIFGIPFLAADEKNSDAIAYSTLLRALKSASFPEALVTEEDLREYLNLITSCEVQINEYASELIRKYFVASRRAHPERLPVNAVATITALSEAYARLCLKEEVTPEHVTAILQLYEESLNYIHGPSLINAPPPTVLSQGMNVPEWIHCTSEQFSSWLVHFIHSFVGNSQFS